ncbi:MAG: ATP-dependent zinc metalloprotease FtsH [Ktedonobacterales bacterium]
MQMMQSTRPPSGPGQPTPSPGQRETGQPSRPSQNGSHLPNGRPGGSGPQGTSPNRRRFWLQMLIFVIVINLLFYAPLLFSSLGARQSTITLSYTSFLQQVQNGNVKDVTLTGHAVSGDFRTPLHQQQSGSSTGTATYSQFSSYVPETGDPTLLPVLQKNGVNVTAQPVQIPWWQTALSTLLNALPILLLVYFGYMALRGVRQSQQGGGIFGVGRSRAKLYNEERPSTTFADVAGADEAKADLREEIDFLREPQRYLAIGAHIPKGVLLVGPPGTGKTLLARAVAGEAGVPFYSVSGTDFVEVFVGVGASRVRDLFEQAMKNAPCIVFIDEIDAIGRTRGGASALSGNDEREQTLEQLLVAMDGFEPNQAVVVLAATNRPDVLDPALLRPGRFDRQITVDLPERRGREAILKIHTSTVPLAPDVNLADLARVTPGFSGADLANLVNEAALAAARRGSVQVSRQDFENALDKLLLGGKREALMDERERRIVAYHEGGHALVAAVLPDVDPLYKVTIVPRGRSLGVTQFLPEDDRRNLPRSYLVERLAVALGGRTAEELALGESTTGAENDLKGASQLARRMVSEWGMGEQTGPVVYDLSDGSPSLSQQALEGHERVYSEVTAERLDAEVERLITQAHQQARTVLTEHRDALDRLAQALVQEEVLEREQVLAIVHGSQKTQDAVSSEKAPRSETVPIAERGASG